MAQFIEMAEFIKSPCVKICKYEKSFMNGNVCIGCFREQHEITNWVKMSNSDKLLVLDDAKERKREFLKYNV